MALFFPLKPNHTLTTLHQKCRLIENEYLGLKNGILDQSAILLSSYGCLTCMDCKVNFSCNVLSYFQDFSFSNCVLSIVFRSDAEHFMLSIMLSCTTFLLKSLVICIGVLVLKSCILHMVWAWCWLLEWKSLSTRSLIIKTETNLYKTNSICKFGKVYSYVDRNNFLVIFVNAVRFIDFKLQSLKWLMLHNLV